MFCYNCMNRISDQNNYCRHCGRNSYPDRTPHHITPGSDLKGRYLVGNAVGEDGFTITYVARDLNIDERVVLKEYYPMGHVHRDSDTSNEIVLNSQDEAAYFGKGSDQFISDAREAKRSGKADVRDIFTENGTVYLVTSYHGQQLGSRSHASGSENYNDGYEGESLENERDKTDISSAANKPSQPKNKTGMIIAISVSAAVVVALAVIMIVFFANSKGKADHEATTEVVTTVPPTEAPTTEEPTTESSDIEMPDVRGKKLSDAESQLRELGLKTEVTREYSNTVAKDYILRQSIGSGQTVLKGDTVMLYVSDGPVPEPTTVPKPTTAPKTTAPKTTTPKTTSPKSSQSSNSESGNWLDRIAEYFDSENQ